MAKLIVKLHGEIIGTFDLDPSVEYIAGRGQDAQIVLPPQKGISRHHLKFYFKEDRWVVETLSKFLPLRQGDQNSEILELSESQSFSLNPFDFSFEADVVPQIEDAKPVENPPAPISKPRKSEPKADDTSPKLNNEATVAGGGSLVPYVRIDSPNSTDEMTLKLEGHLWVAGRESASEIVLDTPHASRKHFEIIRTPEGFFVTDLGSANGTKLNGQRLPPHEPTKMESGDVLSVQQISIHFEIRDVQFAKRISNLPALQDPFMHQQPMAWPVPTNYNPAYESSEEESQITGWKKHFNWKEHKLRVVLACAIPIIFALMFSDSKPAQPKRDPSAVPQTPNNVSFEQMTNEQKNAIKDSFNLARNLYVQGKYELCITEVAKLHSMIPFFENSKELEEFCKQGRELVIRQKDQERKEREKAIIEQNIKDIVEACNAKLPKNADIEKTRKCLIEAIELDPEHPLITQALAAAQQREAERKAHDAEKRAQGAKAARGQQHFTKAKLLYKSGKLAKALTEYEKFVGTPYPNSEANKDAARRDIASIKVQLKAKVSSFIEQCKSLGEKGHFKDAYLACDKAVEEDPNNDQAKTMRDQMLSQLRTEIKSVYEDSVLEESMGNVDAAKEKWNKIIKENLNFDDYTTKAKSKLQKYGVGI